MILIKFALISIKEKIGRTLLILVSLTLTAALFFATLSISNTLGKVFENQTRRYVGESDFIIHMRKDSKGYLNAKDASEIEGVQKSIGVLNTEGQYKPTPYEQIKLNILGMTMEDYEELYDLTILEKLEDHQLNLKSIVVSSLFMEKYDLNLGDSIDLIIRDSKYKFNIGYVVAPTFQFTPDKNNPNNETVLIRKDYLNRLYAMNGKYFSIYIINEEGVDSKVIKEELEGVFKNYGVRKSVDYDQIESLLSMFKSMFTMLLVMVIIISVFIIYTSFKVIMYGKLKVIGTFRSIGATKKKTTFILLLESILYGFLGGILGFFIGIGILYLMAYFMSYNPWTKQTGEITLVYNNIQILWTVAFSIILVIIGSILPITKAVKIPIKEIILGMTSKVNNKKFLKSKIALTVIILLSIIPPLLPKGYAIAAGISTLVILFLIGIAMPYVVYKFCFVLEKVFQRFFGSIGIIAIKNVRENKNVINNMTLLTVGLITLILINVIAFSTAELLTNFYSKMDFHIWMSTTGDIRHTEQKVRSIQGISDIYVVKNQPSVVTKEIGNVSLLGIEPKEYYEFVNDRIDADINSLSMLFNEKRCIILPLVLKERYNLKKGDLITLETNEGDREYEIVAFTDSIMNMSRTVYASLQFIKRDFYLSNEVICYIRLDNGLNNEAVNEKIKEKFRNRYIDTNTLENLEAIERQNNNNLFMMFRVFSLVASLIGIIGMFNNFMLNLISRQRIFAVMNSVGLSKKQTRLLVLLEALSVGIIGAVLGIIGSVVLLRIVVIVLEVFLGEMKIHYDTSMFIQMFIGAIIVAITGSLMPLKKAARINIVEAIKYE